MPKLPYLVSLLLLAPLTLGAAQTTADRGPHGDPNLLPAGCSSCHVGHGVKGAPMLPVDEVDLCLACHGSRPSALAMQRQGKLALNVFPDDLEAVFKKLSSHPIWDRGKHSPSEGLYPKGERHAECADCHEHHRVTAYKQSGASAMKRSPLLAFTFEYDLCYRCHGAQAGASKDISALFNTGNRSYHPVEGRAKGTGRGLLPPWAADSVMACTDCHGNNDPNGPKGPHGSDFAPILIKRYDTSDGQESPDRYALCYSCHDRNQLYTTSDFGGHGRHVQQAGLACADCHSAHGSVNNRALIQFAGPNVLPSKSGRLEYDSNAPGTGQCYVNCHGVEHNPLSYP